MLEINNLKVSAGRHDLLKVDSFSMPDRMRLGIVGESGSGKTMMTLSIAGLQPRELSISGSVEFGGRDLSVLSPQEMARVRGKEIGFVFQDPNRALNPTMRIGRQVAEAVRLHSHQTRRERDAAVLGLLGDVQLRNPRDIARRYPHEISGGQQQRVMIAIAIASRPRLLIADEPTTALDVTVQRRVLDLLADLSQEHGMALILVSHDLGVVSSICDTVAVMYGGRVVEVGPVERIVSSPSHRYTEALIEANLRLEVSEGRVGERLRTIAGTVPAVGNFPDGCRFRNRCAFATSECESEPAVARFDTNHWFTCWNPANDLVKA